MACGLVALLALPRSGKAAPSGMTGGGGSHRLNPFNPCQPYGGATLIGP